MKLDMHCHTKEGSLDGKISIRDAIYLLREKGYQGMLITDHNSYKAYRYYKKNIMGKEFDDFVVLKGIEYDTIDAGHIIIVMPTGVNLPLLELRGLPVHLLIDIVHHFGGMLGPAHPCGEKYLSLMNTKRGKKSRGLMARFDFVETYNACESAKSNNAARELAERFGKPGIGGSDSHREESIGFGYTMIEAEIKNETDLIHALRSDVAITSGGEQYMFTTKQRIGRMNNVLIYSFWFYNKFLALYKKNSRNMELLKNHLYEYVPSHKEWKYKNQVH
ncbi:MAG: PHP domain-containing protein [Clostridiales bacterium]|nr:PHP domain-containing protein [Clostridiales bacterium]